MKSDVYQVSNDFRGMHCVSCDKFGRACSLTPATLEGPDWTWLCSQHRRSPSPSQESQPMPVPSSSSISSPLSRLIESRGEQFREELISLLSSILTDLDKIKDSVSASQVTELNLSTIEDTIDYDPEKQ